MLKDNIAETFKELEKEKEAKDNNMSENANMNFRGELEIWGTRNGKIYYHNKGENIVTNWAKHATVHLLTGEVYTTHGDRNIVDASTVTAFTKRSIVGTDHTALVNNDGTVMSNGAYLEDNTRYYDVGNARYTYQSINNPDNTVNVGLGDSTDDFVYPYFPTKFLFGTGIEYEDWQAVIDDNRDGEGQGGYEDSVNGSWTETGFNNILNAALPDSISYENYYSALWDGTGYTLTRTRTMNDIYRGAFSDTDNPVTEDSFGVKGAIKNGLYDGTNGTTVLTAGAPYSSSGSYRGVGRPAFIYATRASRFMQDGDILVETGEVIGTEQLESKITFQIIMPEQESGEFYPHNGYTMKVAGLFADAAMVLGNTVPADETDIADHVDEYTNYKKMPGGILWATRNIPPLYKSHDSVIIAQWTIYL